MAGRRTKLTQELQERIVAYVRGGTWDYVAAQAAGISKATFYRWYNDGRNPRSRYAPFREEIDTARAQARVVAETTVFRAKPESWLKFGPGRERPGAPGWTTPTRAWTEDPDAETLQAAAERLAAKHGLDADELLESAGRIARGKERLRNAAGDPDLFVEDDSG